MRDFGQYDSPRAEGFTLTELLVAIAIFITLLGGVGALFVGAVRTTRQGFQNQEAYETARAALSIIESDLTRAFASRDHGQYYSFYGTPIGFTFVGLAAPRDNRPTGNLARVTYVVYRDFVSNRFGEGKASIDSETGNADRFTFRLLRFVEPGVGSLDDFPIDWLQPITNDFAGTTYSMANLLDVACDGCLSANGPIGPASFVNLNRGAEQLVNTAKREIWIRMLGGGDGQVPNAWDPTNGVLDLSRGAPGYPEPFDFAVGEDILLVQNETGDADAITSGTVWPNISNFDSAFINAGPTVDAQSGNVVADSVATYFFAYASIEQRLSGDGSDQANYDTYTNDRIGEFVTEYRAYWNDLRNLFDLSNTLVEDAPGSPFRPRLPQQVTCQFTLFLESPYPGAPDFQRSFDQRIDLPTGYKRFRKS